MVSEKRLSCSLALNGSTGKSSRFALRTLLPRARTLAVLRTIRVLVSYT